MEIKGKSRLRAKILPQRSRLYFRRFAVVVRQAQLYTFLSLTLIALLQSCRTIPTPQPPPPEPVPEASKPDVSVSDKGSIPELEKPQSILPKPREILPESVLGAPEKDLASARLSYDTVLVARAPDPLSTRGWQYRKNQQAKIVGFEFSNRGGNRILPQRYDVGKNLLFTRDFQFRFDERARQDIHLLISDWAPSRDGQFRLSELMNSVMHFFPRNYLPAIITSGGRSVVTLPTGEEVEFDAKTYEIVGGVFLEAPVDLNPDKAARQFPRVDYTGKGVIVRADSRGKDPRVGTMAMITTGSPTWDCEKGTGCDQCQVPSKELWDQSGAVRFKFPTDAEFDRYLVSRCGFGLYRTE